MAGTSALVLDVGNCDPDHGQLAGMLNCHFDVTIDRVMHVSEALQKMRERTYNLVLVNRLIFADSSPGLALIQEVKADASLNEVPIMMISNFPQAQAKAVQAGGLPGFGKNHLEDVATHRLLSAYLPSKRGSNVARTGKTG